MISVIIVNYNSVHLTKRAVDSVVGEDKAAEIFVVDNTATDAERLALGTLLYPNVKLIFNETNEGFAKACNQAFALSKGDYLLLLNPDAYVIPPCLSVLRDFIAKTPNAGSVSPQVYWDSNMEYFFPHYTYPSPGQEFFVKLSRVTDFFGTLYSLYKRRKNLKLWKASRPQKTANLHGGVVMLSRTAVEHAGGLFDERFFMFYEDSDLFLRLKRAGYKLYIVPTAKAVHNYCHKEEKLDLMTQAGKLFYEKHFNKSFMLKVAALIPERRKTRYCVNHGTWNTPPTFPVHVELRDGFLFEWSPSPLFVPVIGCFGKGDTFVLSNEVWNLLEEGIYYSRLTPQSNKCPDYKLYLWSKVK